MVSQITTGYPADENGRSYRRRRYAPAIIVTVVLVIVGVVVWVVALSDTQASSAPTDCNQPTPATSTPGETPAATLAAPVRLDAVARADMLEVSPAPLSTFQVRVLNASGERGVARSVADDLSGQGFNPAPDNPYGDDTVYPNRDLHCVAQIRFGPAGRAGAAAVWLAFPCAQLVNDNRRGTTVDVALGEYYKSSELSQDTLAALEVLRTADPKKPETGVDPALLKAVHSSTC